MNRVRPEPFLDARPEEVQAEHVEQDVRDAVRAWRNMYVTIVHGWHEDVSRRELEQRANQPATVCSRKKTMTFAMISRLTHGVTGEAPSGGESSLNYQIVSEGVILRGRPSVRSASSQ